MKTSIYFIQYRFNVKYRFGKKHVIPDTFSRLLLGNGPATLPKNNPHDFSNLDIYFCGILNLSNNVNCYIFQFFFLNMTDEFKKQIFDGYVRENIWNKLIKMLKSFTERFRRENTKNIPVTNAITPVTPVTVTRKR